MALGTPPLVWFCAATWSDFAPALTLLVKFETSTSYSPRPLWINRILTNRLDYRVSQPAISQRNRRLVKLMISQEPQLR